MKAKIFFTLFCFTFFSRKKINYHGDIVKDFIVKSENSISSSLKNKKSLETIQENTKQEKNFFYILLFFISVIIIILLIKKLKEKKKSMIQSNKDTEKTFTVGEKLIDEELTDEQKYRKAIEKIKENQNIISGKIEKQKKAIAEVSEKIGKSVEILKLNFGASNKIIVIIKSPNVSFLILQKEKFFGTYFYSYTSITEDEDEKNEDPLIKKILSVLKQRVTFETIQEKIPQEKIQQFSSDIPETEKINHMVVQSEDFNKFF